MLCPSGLWRASWQQIVAAVRAEPEWQWLTSELAARYVL